MNLTAFQQSAFLQSLGWAIANSVWQAGVLWFLYHIIVSSYSNASSKFKTNVSTVFLFSTFLWFIITFFNRLIYLQKEIPEAVPNQLNFFTDFYSGSHGFSLNKFIHVIGITLPYLSVAYLLLLLIFTARLINSYRNTIFIRYNGLKKPGVEWRLFVEKVAGHMDINKKIKLWFSKHVDVPATIGFIKPVILIPLALLNKLTADQLEAIILHELSHIKRNDYLINLFISLIETVLFFNPFIVLLSKIIKKERENCCDDFVLQYQYDRHSYASALLSLEKYRIQNLHLALTATSGKKQLLFRIKRIMEVKRNNKSLNYGQKLIALLLTTGIICSIAWLSPARKSNQSFNSKQLPGKNLADEKPEIDKEKNTFLRFKDATTINSYVQPKTIIKDKAITLIDDTSKKNNSFEKTAEGMLTWEMKDDEIENNLQLTGAHNKNNEVVVPNIPAFEISAGEDNLFFLPRFSMPDLKFLENLNFYVDINKLQAEIEKSNQSFSSIDWDNIQQELIESLEKIKMAPRSIINMGKDQVEFINKHYKKREKNNKEFQFSFTTDNKNKNNFPGWNINFRTDDSLITKNINSSNNNKDRFFYYQTDENNFSTPAPTPGKRNRTIKITPQLSTHSPAYTNQDKMSAIYVTHREKLPHKQSIHIDCRNGSVTINGKKMHSSELKNIMRKHKKNITLL